MERGCNSGAWKAGGPPQGQPGCAAATFALPPPPPVAGGARTNIHPHAAALHLPQGLPKGSDLLIRFFESEWFDTFIALT